MKLMQKITLTCMAIIMSNIVLAHEGLHAAGQVHAGGSHIGLFEVALAVIAVIALVAFQLKKYKSRK